MLGLFAAVIAQIWGRFASPMPPLQYGTAEAVGSVLHSGSFEIGATERVIQYIYGTLHPNPKWAERHKVFCSQFVIACYQAAAGIMILAQMRGLVCPPGYKGFEQITRSVQEFIHKVGLDQSTMKILFTHPLMLKIDALHSSVRALDAFLLGSKIFYFKDIYALR